MPPDDKLPIWRKRIGNMPIGPLADDSWRLALGWGLGRWLAFGLFFDRLIGGHHIPRTGPCILAPNHPSWLDPALVWLPLPRRAHVMAWEPTFRIPLGGWLVAAGGGFPVFDDNPREALMHARRLLDAGRCIGLFPEGGRSEPDGTIKPFMHGVATLALWTGAPIVPMTVNGSLRAWPRGRKFPRLFTKVRVIAHKPIPPPATGRDALRGDAPAQLLAAVRAAILADYEDWPRGASRDGGVSPLDPSAPAPV